MMQMEDSMLLAGQLFYLSRFFFGSSSFGKEQLARISIPMHPSRVPTANRVRARHLCTCPQFNEDTAVTRCVGQKSSWPLADNSIKFGSMVAIRAA